MERTDEDLMPAVASGNLEAFEQLVLRHQAEAWRVAYRYAGDAAEAEDLAQSAFLKLLDAAPRYKVTAKFRTYFFRILTRLCIDHGRKKRPILIEVLPDLADESALPSQQASQAEREIL